MKSDVNTSRGGLTQKLGRQSRGAWQMQYSAVLSRSEAAARQVRAREEIRSPLVVPFWTEKALTTTVLDSDAVHIDRLPDYDWFTPGDWVYIVPPAGAAEFREILSVDGDTLFLNSGAEYGSGLAIYPCRFCMRSADGATFETTSEDSVVEPLTYMTL
jgi:hypothetical protein